MADYWTYCQNWHTRTRQPVGPIYASGLFEKGYRRIPWHGALEPEHIQAGFCIECKQSFAEGLGVLGTESKRYEFCSNLHYLNWWKRQHPDEEAPMSNSIWEH